VLWIRAQEIILENPLLGVGSTFWVRQPQTTALLANYSTHNLALEVVLSTGVLGALALVGAVVMCARRASTDARIIGLGFAVVWLAGGITEVTSAPGRLYLIPALLPLVFVMLNARSETSLDPVPEEQLERTTRSPESPSTSSPAVKTAPRPRLR
jgi:O-antigen ligase